MLPASRLIAVIPPGVYLMNLRPIPREPPLSKGGGRRSLPEGFRIRNAASRMLPASRLIAVIPPGVYLMSLRPIPREPPLSKGGGRRSLPEGFRIRNAALIMPRSLPEGFKRGIPRSLESFSCRMKGIDPMRAVVTRVSSASVTADGVLTGEIGKGFLVLLGVGPDDTPAIAEKLADKVLGLRVFEDENGKMNLNLASVGGSLLVVSQFTLYADLKSRRPGFTGAAKPETAVPLYELFVNTCRKAGFRTETGVFGAHMEVASLNDGPVTLLLDTDA